MLNISKKNLFYFCFLLIIIFAGILRIRYLFDFTGLSYDELYVWKIASNSNIIDLFKELINTDYHPPLHFMFIHYWMNLFSSSDFSLRCSSLLFSFGIVIVFYFIGKEVKDKNIGIIFLLLATFYPFSVYFSQNVRFYILSDLIIALIFLQLYRLLKSEKIKDIVILILLNLLLLYTQTMGSIFVFGEFVSLLLYYYFKNKKLCKTILKASILNFLFYLPQLYITIAQLINSKHTLLDSPWEWSIWTKYAMLTGNLGLIFPFENKLILCVLLLFSIVFLFANLIKSKDNHINFSLLFFGIYVFLLALSSIFGLIHFNSNILYFSTFNYFLLILCALYVATIKTNKTKIKVCVLIVLSFLLNHNIYEKPGVDDFKYPIEFINNSEYKKSTVFLIRGGQFINKYSNSIKTFDIEADRLFTMKLSQENISNVFDKNIINLSLDDRKKYLKDYLISNVGTNNLKQYFELNINNLEKNEYFIVIIEMHTHMPEIFDLSIKDKQTVINNKWFPLPLMVSSKINYDVLNLANNHKQLKFIQKLTSNNKKWHLYIYQKI